MVNWSYSKFVEMDPMTLLDVQTFFHAQVQKKDILKLICCGNKTNNQKKNKCKKCLSPVVIDIERIHFSTLLERREQWEVEEQKHRQKHKKRAVQELREQYYQSEKDKKEEEVTAQQKGRRPRKE